MPCYTCETCGNSYRQRRNLKRHQDEKHNKRVILECIEVSCVSQFTRRTSLSRHLVRKHGYTGLRAREFAVRAVARSNINHENVAQYEDISDDDTVFDLINEIEIIRTYDEKIVDFDIEYLKDDTLEHGSKETNTSEVDVNGGLSANGDVDFLNGDVDVSVNADDGADLMFDAGDSGNVVVRDDGDVDDSINAEDGADLMFDAGDSGNVVVRDDGGVDDSINAEDGADLMFDAGDSGNVVVRDDGDVDDSINAEDGADLMFDAGDSGNVVVRDDGDVDHSINAEDGADLLFDAGDSGNVVVRNDGDVDDSINSEEGADLMFDAVDSGSSVAGDDGDVDSESEGDDSVIIDSEDDLALEISTSITRRQTFTFTVRKETTYIAGQEVTTNTYKERDYQEDWF